MGKQLIRRLRIPLSSQFFFSFVVLQWSVAWRSLSTKTWHHRDVLRLNLLMFVPYLLMVADGCWWLLYALQGSSQRHSEAWRSWGWLCWENFCCSGTLSVLDLAFSGSAGSSGFAWWFSSRSGIAHATAHWIGYSNYNIWIEIVWDSEKFLLNLAAATCSCNFSTSWAKL